MSVSGSPPADRPTHLVVTIHGIRTFGQWQERLERLLRLRSPDIEVAKIDYGYFSAFAFVVPPLRWFATRRIRRLLFDAFAERDWARVDIVAHSFGTHLVAHALCGAPDERRRRLSIHTLLLSGSVLRPWFSWQRALDPRRGFIRRVVNDCGTRDNVLLMSLLVPLFTGMAGRVGFRGRTGASLRNRYFAVGHSGFFTHPGFMERWWVPLLSDDAPVEPHDERVLRPWSGAAVWIVNRLAEPLKLAAYLFAFYWIGSSYLEASRGARAAKHEASIDEVIERSAGALATSRHNLAAMLAIEASRLNERYGVERDAAAQMAGVAALERRPFAHIIPTNAESTAVALSSDARFLLIGADDGSVACRDRGGDPGWTTVPLGKAPISGIAFHPNAPVAAVSAVNGQIWRLDVSAGCRAVRELSLPACPGMVRSVALGDRGSFVAVGSEGRACLAREGETAPVIVQHVPGAAAVGASDDGKWLAVGGGGRLRLWRLANGRPEHALELPPTPERITAIAFSMDSTILAVGSEAVDLIASEPEQRHRGRVRLWNLHDGQLPARLLADECAGRIAALHFADDWLVGACSDRNVRRWKIRGPYWSEAFAGHAGAVRSVSGDASGRYFASAGAGESSVRFWDARGGPAAPLRFDGPNVPTAIAFSGSDARRLAVAFQAHPSVHVWSIQDPAADPTIYPAADEFGETLAVAARPPLREVLATGGGAFAGSEDTTVKLWEGPDDERKPRLLGRHLGSVLSVAFDSNGRLLVSLGEDGAVRLWDVEAGTTVALAERDLGTRPLAVALDPRPGLRRLAVAGADNQIHLFDLAGGDLVPAARLRAATDVEEEAWRDVAISPDGTFVGAAGADGLVRVWSLDEPARTRVLDDVVRRGGAKPIRRIAFGPGNKTLAAGSADGRVWIWRTDALTQPAAVLAGPRRGVYSLAYAPDGAHLAAGFADGSVLVWRTPHAAMADACPDLQRVLAPEEWKRLADDPDFAPGCEPYTPSRWERLTDRIGSRIRSVARLLPN